MHFHRDWGCWAEGRGWEANDKVAGCFATLPTAESVLPLPTSSQDLGVKKFIMPQRRCLLRRTAAHDCSGFHLMYNSVKVSFLPWLLVAKHSSVNSWWEKESKLWEKKTAADTVLCSLCRISGCLTVETYCYSCCYSIFCWDFLRNNIASLLVTAITCSCAWETQGPTCLCSPTQRNVFPFSSSGHSGVQRFPGSPKAAGDKCSQVSSSLGCGW